MIFEDIDFNELYKKQKEESSFQSKSQESWDKKAKFMNIRVHSSIYNEEFLALIDTKGCDSLLDVGCGVGNLSLRLAKKLKNVYSLDYSKEMLNILNQNAKELDISNIQSINKSWYDLWDDVPNADIVIASRSMEVNDMKNALEKLNEKANKKVFVSYKVGGSFISDEILEVMQRDIQKKPDYIYLVNILYSMGINAKVDFVRSEGRNTIYSSKEKFMESVSWSIGKLSDNEKQRLEKYYDSLNNEKQKSKDYVYWAIISWNKKN